MLSHEIEYGKRAWVTIYNACKEGGIEALAKGIESEIKDKGATYVLSRPDSFDRLKAIHEDDQKIMTSAFRYVEFVNKPGTKFDMEYQYHLYLDKVKLYEYQMPEVQKRQLKMTFFGAWGQCMLHQRDEIAAFDSEDKCVEVLEKQLSEVGNYFLKLKGESN